MSSFCFKPENFVIAIWLPFLKKLLNLYLLKQKFSLISAVEFNYCKDKFSNLNSF